MTISRRIGTHTELGRYPQELALIQNRVCRGHRTLISTCGSLQQSNVHLSRSRLIVDQIDAKKVVGRKRAFLPSANHLLPVSEARLIPMQSRPPIMWCIDRSELESSIWAIICYIARSVMSVTKHGASNFNELEVRMHWLGRKISHSILLELRCLLDTMLLSTLKAKNFHQPGLSVTSRLPSYHHMFWAYGHALREHPGGLQTVGWYCGIALLASR